MKKITGAVAFHTHFDWKTKVMSMDDLWKVGNRSAYDRRNPEHRQPEQPEWIAPTYKCTNQTGKHEYVNIPHGDLSNLYDIVCRTCGYHRGWFESRSSKGHKNRKGSQWKRRTKREVI